MGLTKTSLYTPQQNELANLFKVLGHPARLAIIQQLLELKSCICGDFTQEIGLAQPTISKHLKELKTIGIIQGEIEGTSVCYCIDPVRWQAIQEQLNGLFELLETDGECC
jgi:DNA-binding transcriptional ArsR family regulator